MSGGARSGLKLVQKTLKEIANPIEGPSREHTLQKIAEYVRTRRERMRRRRADKDWAAPSEEGADDSAYRRGWEVKAAYWVKRQHIDRGDVKVGLHSTTGQFHVLKSLLPRYVVPDLKNFPLKPYVAHLKPEDPTKTGKGA